MKDDLLRVGALAKRVGLTVRTLHHWDQIGLLTPGHRTTSGHRIYGPEEIHRLQRILSLRELGLSLQDIATILQTDPPSLEEVLGVQLERVREQMERLRELEHRLGWILERLTDGEVVGQEELLDIMEKMARIERHFSAQQLETLAARREALGPETIREAEAEWPRLIAAVRRVMERGADPRSPEVQALAQRWKALVQAFSGGDAGIEASLATMYRSEPDIATDQGLDPALFRFVGAAMQDANEG